MDVAEFTTAYADVVSTLPSHLAKYCVAQRYSLYTRENQRTWRYIMARLEPYLSEHAHAAYRSGLRAVGIGPDTIPNIDVMNAQLATLDWRVVAVDGFLPPSVFMAFQAARVLPISVDMREAQHVFYTPAPDIVHEAAGHAPLLADPAYSRFLERIGDYGSKVLVQSLDVQAYTATRALSDAMALGADRATIKSAQRAVIDAEHAQRGAVCSEASMLARFHWWTVEYGLLGDANDSRIYGAGLLSSMREARRCLQSDVTRLPLTLAVLDDIYDITIEQPHYYVARDLDAVIDALESVAARCAFRKTGAPAARALVDHGTLGSAVLSSGLGILGVFSEWLSASGKLAYLRTTGPTRLYYGDQPLHGHCVKRHPHGYGTAIGPRRDSGIMECGRHLTLEFASGVSVVGQLQDVLSRDGQAVLASFTQCTVTAPDGTLLFHPDWGQYDLALADELSSAFGGSPDGSVSPYETLAV